MQFLSLLANCARILDGGSLLTRKSFAGLLLCVASKPTGIEKMGIARAFLRKMKSKCGIIVGRSK
jgi:hypothetical protein